VIEQTERMKILSVTVERVFPLSHADLWVLIGDLGDTGKRLVGRLKRVLRKARGKEHSNPIKRQCLPGQRGYISRSDLAGLSC